ncbi:uncharacterized protein ACBR49_007003 [Aulostomus maculatus]
MVGGQIRYSVPEEMKKGSVIGNVAQDLGLDVKRLLSGRARIVTGENIQYTELKTDKGLLVVNERIDREQLCRDVTPCSFSFEMILENPIELHRITVEVLDINDHAPVFPNKDKSLSFEISESAVVGVQFPLQSAEDPDVGQNTLQDYILSPNDNFILKQHANPDGSKYVEMVLQKPLDRERRPRLSLKLIAVDGGTPQRSGSVNIDVTVLDANDNVPIFNQSVYKASVMENTVKGTSVITVNASDADSGSYGLITYSLSRMKGSAADIFSIDGNTGTISVSGQIDFEVERKYELRVEAKDHGGLTGTSKVILDVIDVNDNAPVINIMSFSSPVSEDAPPGTTIAVLNIKDADFERNGQIKCTIDGKLPFKIESSLTDYYNLISDQYFDRESVSEYNITVTAADFGTPPLSTSTKLQLKISDVNDNAPVFATNVYSASITENNSPGVSIFAVSARDSDWNQNARISYVLEDTQVSGGPVSTYVSLNSETGVLSAVRSFDYELIKEFQLVVKAQDGGSPPLSSNVTVKILIQDQNDNPPQVLYPVQTGGSLVAEMVPRSADVGYLVTKVVAVDVDSGQNAWLSYKLQKATDRALFEVGSQNGEIRTIRQVTDKDAVKQRLSVIVEDNGQPSRSATVVVNVAVADSFPEVLSEFTDLSQDKEYNDNLTFYLVLALAVVSFLFITCLVVIISVKIYRWRQSRILYHSSLPVIPYYPPRYSDTLGTGTLQHVYNYEVCRTTDSRKSDCKLGRAGSQNVLIMEPGSTGTMQRMQTEKSILDEPDSPLEVSGQIRYSVPEEMKKGSVIGNVAQDLGLDVKRLLSGRARIVTEENIQYTELKTDKGLLVVNERIDRELLCGDVTPCSFSFEMILENPIELHRITVEVLDINDHAPVFPNKDKSLSFEISESAVVGVQFPLQSAEDPDVGQNTLQDYILSPNDNFILKQHANPDGSKYVEMVLQKPLDRERRPRLSLKLIAVDGGTPQRSGSVNIDVTVLDANDNVPIFNQSVYKASVMENTVKGTSVITVNASDADSGSYGLITYSLSRMKGSAADIFSIDGNTGTISVSGQIDFEKNRKYELRVEAKDHGGLTGTSKVILDVIDVNDNAPVINIMSFSSPVSEDAPPEDTQVSGGPVSTYVSLNSETGVLSAVRSFDYELIKEFQLVVKAQDGGSPPLSSNVTVKVLIQDQNDNPPQVLYPVQTGGSLVAEMVPRSADVGYLKATDRALFEVGSQNGEIRTIRQVTDKDAVKQRLSVIVEDNGQPSRSATVVVNVAVADSFPEVLSEFTDLSQDKEYNDNLTFYLVLALAVVSFLFITCLVVIISVKIYRWRQSRILYHSSLPVIPYYPPRYSDTLGTGTLQHVYNYEVCRTTDSRKSDCKLGRAGSQNVLIMEPGSTGTMQRMQTEKSILDEPDSPLEWNAAVFLPVAMACGLSPNIRRVQWRTGCRQNWLLLFFFLYTHHMVGGHIRYSIPEEMKKGSVIGNVAQDLGLDLKRLLSGRARIVTGESVQYTRLVTDKGILVVNERIDREQLCGEVTPCSFSFEVILENPMELHQITVEITDINDHSPTFKRNNINFEISEAAHIGARFSLTSADDPDVGVNGLREYLLTQNDHFTLKQNSNADGKKYAEMVLQKPLDREEHPNLSLKLIAVDGGTPQRSGTVNIYVTVLDANDNAPVFNQSVYKATVLENAPKDTYVTTLNASDADSGSNGIVTYYFSDIDSGHGDLFVIDEKTGVVSIKGALDYEREKKYELRIDAKDQGGLTDSSKVIIDVIDVNDNAPVISVMSFTSPVSEDAPPGTTIGIINVKDLDSGENGQVTCRIEQNAPFKVKSNLRNYYTLVTDVVLDRERVSEYNISVVATDAGRPPLSAQRTFHLKISDVNDNPPVFEESVYSAFITENNSPGVSIITLRAKDPDENQNARISYILEDTGVSGSPVSGYVSINAESGVIHAMCSFDYEQLKQLIIVIKAQDGGSPPLSSNVTVKILIQDQNDNPPQVLYPVQTGGSLVAEMVPRSADVGYLKATDRALFEVGSQNGEIRTIRQVTDKDAVKQRLSVIVEDNGQPSRSATVVVNVAVADSFPEVLSEFTDLSQDKEYNDNLTFYLVLALAVVSFLFITCLVVIISVKIYRWRQSRILYHSSLPVIPYYPPRYSDTLGTGTLQHVYNYEVCRTTDSRKSDCKLGRAGSQNVLIMEPGSTGTMQRMQTEKSILDEPDSPLEVSKWRLCSAPLWLLLLLLLCFSCTVAGQIRYSIPEEMKKGSLIGNVAQDLGLDMKRLSSGRAHIVTGENNQYTELKTDKGILVVDERIDREQLCGDVTPCSFSFEIILENPVELHHVTIEVLDVNDHSPAFKKSDIMLDISESANLGARFVLDSAEDPDVGVNGLQNYVLTPNDNFLLKQHVNPDGSKYAEMVLQKQLDREEVPRLSLKLIAVDGGNPQRSGTVNININVLDANDNAPTFNQSVYKATVVENAAIGTSIVTVNATDADSGSNGFIIYSISNMKSNIADLLSIDPGTGVLSVSGPIDFERDKKYELRIDAKDQGGLTDSSKVIIDVIDVNDNAPVISVMSFTSPVSEDAPPGTTIGIINVKDLDSGENGQVTCRIEQNAPFKVKSNLRNYYTLVTDVVLDRERVSEYNISVVATDAGRPPLSAQRTFHLKISDVNDNPPVFEESVYSAFITENNSPGVSIITLRAKDPDENQNARISYILEDTGVSGSPVSGYVSINAESGVIHAMRSFDYEQLKQLIIVIKAQDGGSPPLSSNVTVKILIQDQNDNPPQVLYPVQTGGSLVAEMVPRSADVGYLVTKVVAVDVDSGQNAWLSYKLQKATDRALFEVGSQNGEIRTIRQVTDKDAVKQRLSVIVEDNGQPSRSATVVVNVAVADSFPEVLSEFTDLSQDKEYNDNLTFYLVLALAVVSFLFITCLVVIISVKIYRWRQSRILYHSSLPVIPYYPPRYSDTLGTGTLQHVYNYEVCRTTDSRKSDMKYAPPMSQSLVSVDGAESDAPLADKQLSGTCSQMSTLVSHVFNQSLSSWFVFLIPSQCEREN